VILGLLGDFWKQVQLNHAQQKNQDTVNLQWGVERTGMLKIIQAQFLTWTLGSYGILIELTSPSPINLAKPVKHPI
jgi:hypothetical protein